MDCWAGPEKGSVVEILVSRLWGAPQNAEHRATTTGTISIDGSQCCFSLEPTQLMIPPGTYPISLQMSARFQRRTPHLVVPGRTFIELHGGNHASDSEGCILLATKRLDDYTIAESKPATDYIEMKLGQAESNGEHSTVSIQTST